MEEKSRFISGRRPPDLIFILLLLCVLALGSFLFIVFGAEIYQSVTQKADQNAQLRTVLSYITTKVRQNDVPETVQLRNKDGITALVLKNEEEGQTYYTWIYEYDGYLREVYVDEQTEFDLSDGFSMIPSYGLELTPVGNNGITVKVYDQKGNSLETAVALRIGNVEAGGEQNEK